VCRRRLGLGSRGGRRCHGGCDESEDDQESRGNPKAKAERGSVERGA
jgi:hypothetical protein